MINKLDFITKQALLIKVKNKQLGNTKAARKAKKNQQRAINMKNNYSNEENNLNDEIHILTACDPNTGLIIGYYDNEGNIINFNDTINDNITIIDDSSDESSDESESIELTNQISESEANNFALDENYRMKPNTHKKKKDIPKSLKKTKKNINDDFDDL